MYFNIVSSIIVLNETTTAKSRKYAKLFFIWLFPAIGSLFALRFSRQIEENSLHDKFVPVFMGKWIYDEASYNLNKNRDENDLKTVHGISTYDHSSRER